MTSSSPPFAVTEDGNPRLGSNVVPSHYDLVIRTDLSNKSFTGTALITLLIASPTPSLTLNLAPPLTLSRALLLTTSLKTSSSLPSSLITVDPKRERVTIEFEGGEIGKGEVRVGLRFGGVLEGSMMGYYLSSYKDEVGGGEAGYGLTQFEPTQARRAFPCFDEPSLKSTFTISLLSKSDTVSLSNMDAVSSVAVEDGLLPRGEVFGEDFYAEDTPTAGVEGKTEGKTTTTKTEGKTEIAIKTEGKTEIATKPEWTLTTFSRTPKMSTYLVAWANGKFYNKKSYYVSPITGKRVELGVWATWDHIAQAGLALETKVRILPIYERLFDIAFPLPKLDTLVASDFDAGAMENWGLITGRTSVYLYDSKKSGIASKKRVIGVQSHEVSHQWFGNIVTMEWWDNLWLNEAFATLIGEVIMIEEIEPTWKVHSNFINEHLARALQLDSMRSSHPIEMPCPDEETIQQIFDAISYSKGASVLKMLANMVGQDTFLKGVSLYLKAHLYGNARTADLWAGISESSGQDVAAFMLNWTNKIGFPVITVEENEEGLKLRQNRFLSTNDTTPEEDETIWHIPLEVLSVKDNKVDINHDALLSARELELPFKDVKDSIYKLNAETCGVYRVLYPIDRLIKLGDEAGRKDSFFSLNDRMGLVQDASVLASSGYSKTSGALTLISKLSSETENLVWVEISDALQKLATAWWDQPQDVRDGIAKFRRTLFGPLADRLGFVYGEDDDVDTIELRTMAISVSAACADEVTLAEYKRRFDPFMEKNDESGIPSDLRGSIYAQSVKNGGEAEYLKILEVYRDAPTPSHKSAAIQALCASKDAELLKRTFDFALSDEVKNQDLASFFVGLAGNLVSKRDTWEFFKNNYEEIMKRFKGNFSVANIVKASFSSLSSEKDALAVEDYFSQYDTAIYKQALSQGLDSVRSKAAWVDRDVKDVKTWLSDNKYI